MLKQVRDHIRKLSGVHFNMCVQMLYIQTYVCMCIYIYIYISSYVSLSLSLYVYIYIYIYMCQR